MFEPEIARPIAIALAVIGAIFLALGAQFQNDAVTEHHAPKQLKLKSLHIKQVLDLLRRPRWLTGTVFMGVQWEPWAWELVKKGKLTGYSIGGKAERILVRQTSDSVIAAFHSEKMDGHFYTDNTLFSCFSINEIPLKYFLAFLNSRLYHYVYQYLSAEQGKTLAQVKIGLLEVLPFRHNAALQDQVVALVDLAIDAAREGSSHDLIELEDQIDEMVFQIMEIPLETRERLKKAK